LVLLSGLPGSLQMQVLGTTPLSSSIYPPPTVHVPAIFQGQAVTGQYCNVRTEFQDQPWFRVAENQIYYR
jgi:hypothetical protein